MGVAHKKARTKKSSEDKQQSLSARQRFLAKKSEAKIANILRGAGFSVSESKRVAKAMIDRFCKLAEKTQK